MQEKKIIGAGKQADESQDKFANELLSEAELDNVAGGVGGKIWIDKGETELPDIATTGKYNVTGGIGSGEFVTAGTNLVEVDLDFFSGNRETTGKNRETTGK